MVYLCLFSFRRHAFWHYATFGTTTVTAAADGRRANVVGPIPPNDEIIFRVDRPNGPRCSHWKLNLDHVNSGVLERKCAIPFIMRDAMRLCNMPDDGNGTVGRIEYGESSSRILYRPVTLCVHF